MNRKTVWATVCLVLAMLAGVGLFGFTSAASVPAPAAASATPAAAPTAAAPAATPAPAPAAATPTETPAPAPAAAAPAATPAPAPTAATPAATPAPDPAAALTLADAKAAAFRHAGCAEADVLNCRAYLDYDDGVPECWKVDFCWNGEEYEYELSCHDCSILEWDHEPCDNHSCPHLRAAAPEAATPAPDPAAALTMADAKAAAFRHAGCAEADVLNCRAYLDYDDGVPECWKVDFCWNGEEYEYELSCHDCSILEWDHEPCDDHPHPELHHQESHHSGHHGNRHC